MITCLEWFDKDRANPEVDIFPGAYEKPQKLFDVVVMILLIV